jgi:predicted SnoaL-like aldol condensation-catalyzing enzyme
MATARNRIRTSEKKKASGRAVSHVVKRKSVKATPTRRKPVKRKSAAAQLAANKRLVLTFYSHVIGRKDFDAARKYMGATYRQHSPYATDGHAGLAAFVKFFKENFPNHRYEVKKVLAEGDMVVLHLHGMGGMNPFGEQVVDFFRIKDGKVVEHWDVIQPIPEKSENPNGVF